MALRLLLRRGIESADIAEIADLHMRAFPDFFMSSLGVGFLREFYSGFIGDDSGIVSVAVDGHQIVGVAVGSSSPDGFFSRLLRKRLFRFGILAFRNAIVRPSIALKLVRAVAYRGGVPGVPPNSALLSSICVEPAYAGRGAGRRLLSDWVDQARMAGCEFAYLTTDADGNEAANAFYAKSGWGVSSFFTTASGRQMNCYSIRLMEPEESPKVLMIEAYDKAFVNFREALSVVLARSGSEVLAVAPSIRDAVSAELASRGIRSVEFAMERSSISPVGGVQSVRSLRSVFAAEGADRVIAFGPKPVIYSGLALSGIRSNRTVAVITGLGFGFVGEDLKARTVRVVQKLLYRRALKSFHVVLFQNPDDRHLFERLSLVDDTEQIVGLVNGSGVDLGKFPPSERFPEVPTFLFLGRLQSSKGLSEYLDAAALVKSQFPSVEFRVVGWVDESNPHTAPQGVFERLADRSVVSFDGPSRDVWKDLEASSVLVLPSYREGTPRSVLEAMAVGRAVITTDAPGARETVVDGVNGFMVPVKNVDAIVEAMTRYVEEPELIRIHGRAGLDRARRVYDAEKVNARICEMLAVSV